jgi:hypothetical protein
MANDVIPAFVDLLLGAFVNLIALEVQRTMWERPHEDHRD